MQEVIDHPKHSFHGKNFSQLFSHLSFKTRNQGHPAEKCKQKEPLQSHPFAYETFYSDVLRFCFSLIPVLSGVAPNPINLNQLFKWKISTFPLIVVINVISQTLFCSHPMSWALLFSSTRNFICGVECARGSAAGPSRCPVTASCLPLPRDHWTAVLRPHCSAPFPWDLKLLKTNLQSVFCRQVSQATCIKWLV